MKKNWECPDSKSTGTCDNIKSTGDLPSLSTSKKSQTSCVNIQMHACMYDDNDGLIWIKIKVITCSKFYFSLFYY